MRNQFCRGLFRLFFKSYPEKVGGMDCREILADWAAQRIKGLSLGSAIKDALTPQRHGRAGKDGVKSLVPSFRYPRHGLGMMSEEFARRVCRQGGEVMRGAPSDLG